MKCSACRVDIPPDGDNELYLTLDGGYGMFFDTDFYTHPDHHELVLCHACAHKLVGSSPFLTRLLKGGHFHGFTNDVMDPLCECKSDFLRDWGAL